MSTELVKDDAIEAEARARQERIRGGLVTAAGEYAAAVLAEDWRVLGFASVAAWAADTLGEQAWQPGPRQQVAQLLSAGGMSTRAIAAATGTSQATAQRDVSQNGSPPDQGKPAQGQGTEAKKEADRNARAASKATHERDIFERGRLAGLEEAQHHEEPARDQGVQHQDQGAGEAETAAQAAVAPVPAGELEQLRERYGKLEQLYWQCRNGNERYGKLIGDVFRAARLEPAETGEAFAALLTRLDGLIRQAGAQAPARVRELEDELGQWKQDHGRLISERAAVCAKLGVDPHGRDAAQHMQARLDSLLTTVQRVAAVREAAGAINMDAYNGNVPEEFRRLYEAATS